MAPKQVKFGEVTCSKCNKPYFIYNQHSTLVSCPYCLEEIKENLMEVC